MATELTRELTRKVRTTRQQALVVMLNPEGMWIREPRRRSAYLLPYGVAYQMAVRLHIEAERRAKAAARRARRREVSQ